MAATAAHVRDVNARYHDGAAAGYDAKWGIDFGHAGQQQVLQKVGKAIGAPPPHFADALELGAGTGYFSLNLLNAGVIGNATCTDISAGMITTLEANACRLGLDVATAVCDAGRLPFTDASFDLVLGHAVLHHIPELERAFAEMRRVLRPGGTICFAGEPSRRGDRLARIPKRAAMTLAPIWRRVLGAAPAVPGSTDGGPENHELEPFVDVHAFSPAALRSVATHTGFVDVRVGGEELLANWFGWFNRTLEATADPDTVPFAFKRFAHRGYLTLQKADLLMERVVPAAFTYNLLVSARTPPM